MSRVLKYSPCPRCRERGKDSRGDNLVNYADGGVHCFSCGYHRSGNVLGVRVSNDVERHVNEKILPYDYTSEVEPAGWRWLLQYGLSISYWKPFVGYSSSTGRLVFKVGDSFSIGRLVEEGKEGRKWYVWGDRHKHSEVIGPQESPVTVLVEDIVSAHKVGQQFETIPLFGTEIHKAYVYTLRDGTRRPIVLWQDEDQRGSVEKKALRLEMLTDRPVMVIFTKQDPKCLSFNDIKDVVDGCLV